MTTRAAQEARRAEVPEGAPEDRWRESGCNLTAATPLHDILKERYVTLMRPMYKGDGVMPHQLYAVEVRELMLELGHAFRSTLVRCQSPGGGPAGRSGDLEKPTSRLARSNQPHTAIPKSDLSAGAPARSYS